MKFCLSYAFIGFLILGPIASNLAQGDRQISISAQISWYDQLPEERKSDPENFFSGAIVDNSHGLPWFVYRVKLARVQNIPAYRFSSEDVTEMPENMLNLLPRRSLDSDWQVKLDVSDAGGSPYLIIQILPIRIRQGIAERLESFTLNLEGSPSPGNLRLGGGNFPFADHSVLSEGTWFKLAIARDGVYRIDRNLLNQLGVDLSGLNPQQINIYGNGGALLPSDNSVFRPDDLQKNAIVVAGEEDGTFDSGDYILFYGKGPDTWTLAHNNDLERSLWTQTKHYYSDSAYYYLRTDDGTPMRIADAPTPLEPETAISSVFQDYQYLENDLYNLVKSGREFYGDQFDLTTSASYGFSFPSIDDTPATVSFSGASRSIGDASSFTVSASGISKTVSIPSVGTGATSAAARVGSTAFSINPSTASVSVGVTYNKANPEAVGWLDYITVNATRNLIMAGNQMKFRDTLVTAPGAIARFDLGQASSLFGLWDITNPLIPLRTTYSLSGNVAQWKSSTEETREFIAFLNTGYLTPTPKGRVENQDLHSMPTPDLMIVTSPRLIQAAQDLAAVHESEGLSVAIATPIQIFNEFSSGNPDVTAIRMLMMMFYQRAEGNPDLMPGNLLLFGDGNYLRNKGLDAQNDFNVIVFESDNSLFPTTSYVSDDYFVMLSDNDTDSPTGLLDCGVGRIPAASLSEANGYVTKVKRYIAENTSPDGGSYCVGSPETNPFGPWRNLITFVADDQDGNGEAFEQVHLNSSKYLCDQVRSAHPEYDQVKIFMDAYSQESTPGGERYPDGEKDIRSRVENGTLLVTYIGHGGERGWAHERILDIPTIENWTNRNRLPVFLTATCELARYDDPSFHSAGEILVMNPQGGAIAMLTTTRIVFSGENFAIDTAFFNVALDETGISNLDLGKINQLTKNGVAVGNDSKPNFSLLGDPALKMAYPRYNVFTTHINGIEIASFQDTLKSLEEVEIRGYVGDQNGNPLSDFDGFVYPSVFDKETKVLTQNNDGGIVQEFDTFNKIIYRGKASATDGEFSFRFVVPYDINYNVAHGRVSYYAVSGSIDGHGAFEEFLIGSALTEAELNTVGPEVNVFMNDSTFISGGLTNTEPVLVVKLADENGINTVGNGIGHDLTAVLDGDTQNPVVLNDFYEADLDTYKSGQVRYQLTDLKPGNHSVRIKAWDVHNNSSESTIEFVVAESAQIALKHVLNYPNPFTTSTSFFFEHNQACQSLEVRIQVFTVGGKLVKTLTQQVLQSGFRSEPIIWDGLDDFGDRLAKGVYVYKLEARNALGQRAEQFEKLVILK